VADGLVVVSIPPRGQPSGTRPAASRARWLTDHREHGAYGNLWRLSDRGRLYRLMRRRFDFPALYRDEGLTHTHGEGDLVERSPAATDRDDGVR
jgi:hypothetical protein